MKLMVIDGNSILNRAYYGIRPLTTRDGLYTHAVFGFLTTLLRLEGEESPDAVCVTFDVHAPTFRHKASEAYKATRKPMPEELRVQVPVLKEVLDALNIPRYELEGWLANPDLDCTLCIDNPYGWVGYGPDFWGLTACDALPSGYMAHSPGIGHDFGTVAPSAALSSMPYTPQESMEVLRNLYRNLGPIAFGIMGFYDAINLGMPDPYKSTRNYLAIDQGPILVMIENHRRATLWTAFMKNNDVRRGLSRLGFTLYQQPVEPIN